MEVKVQVKFMRKSRPPWVEGMVKGVLHQTLQRGHVEVGKATKPTAKVRWRLLCSEDASEVRIVHLFEPLPVNEWRMSNPSSMTAELTLPPSSPLSTH